MDNSIFSNILKKEEIVPVIKIIDKFSGITYTYTSRDDPRSKKEKEKETEKRPYYPQGFLYSLTVNKVKEILSFLIGNRCEISPEEYHLSAYCYKDDGKEQLMSLENAFYDKYGKRDYSIHTLKQDKHSKKKLKELTTLISRDTTHYPLYEFKFVEKGELNLFLDKKSDLNTFDEDKRGLLDELYFKKDSYPVDETEKKRYIQLQAKMMDEYCGDLNSLTSAIYKTKDYKSENNEEINQQITFSSLVSSYNKLVFRSAQPQNAITFYKVFETFPEFITHPETNEKFELLYARYSNKDSKSLYRFIKNAFSNHSDNLLAIDGNLDNYIYDSESKKEGEKITAKKTGKLINLFKTRTYMEKFLDLRDKENVRSGVEKNVELLDLIFRMPSITGKTNIISDNYISILVYPDNSVVVRLLKFDNSILNINKYRDEIESLVSEIRKKIFEINEVSSEDKKKIGMKIQPNKLITSKLHQELIIDKKLSDLNKSISGDLAELNLVTYPNQQTDNELKFSYKQVPYFYTDDNKLRFYLRLKDKENNDSEKVREAWMYSSKYYFMMNEIDAITTLRDITERITESEISETRLDKTNVVSKITLKLESYQDNKTKLIIHGEEIMNFAAFQEICMLIYVSIMMDKKKSGKKKELEEVIIENTTLDFLLDNEETEEFVDEYGLFEEEEDTTSPLQENLVTQANLNISINENDVDTNMDDQVKEEKIKKLLSFDDDMQKPEKIGTHLGKRRNILDKRLFSYDSTDIHDSYSRVCNTSDARQPIILTKAEMDNFKSKNLEAYNDTNFILWGSQEGVKNYYLCANIFCFKCNVALTHKQLIDNDYTCKFCKSGIIQRNNITSKTYVFVRKSSSNYWRDTKIENDETNPYPDKLKGTGKKGHINFIDPKNHPLGLCMPCCAKRAFGHYDKCVKHDIKDFIIVKDPAEMNQKINELKKIRGYQDQIIVIVKKHPSREIDEFDMLKIFKINSKSEVIDVSKEHIFTDIMLPLQIGLHLYLEDGSIFRIEEVDGSSIKIKRIEKKKQVYLQESNKVLATDRYGRLKEVENIFFDNKITANTIYEFEESSRLFIRYGVDQMKNRSFLSAFLYLFYGNNDEKNKRNFIKLIFNTLTLRDFLQLNNGDIARYYSPPFSTIRRNIIQDDFKTFINWCNSDLHKDVISQLYPNTIDKLKGEVRTYLINSVDDTQMTMLLRHFYGFQYFLKHLANYNLELPWRTIIHLVSKGCIWKNYKVNTDGLSENICNNGVNIIVIETTTDYKHTQADKEKMVLLCPSMVDYSINYTEDKPTVLISKTNDIFEPIVLKLVNKVEHSKAKLVSIFHKDMLNTNLEETEYQRIVKLLNIIPESCIPYKEGNRELKPQLSKLFINKDGLEQFKIQIVDFHNRGIGIMIDRDSVPIYTEPFEVREDKDTLSVSNIKPFALDKLINKYDELSKYKDILNSSVLASLQGLYTKIILDDDKTDNIVGLLDQFKQYTPIKKIKKNDPLVEKFEKKFKLSDNPYEYLNNINLYTHYLNKQPLLALKNTENDHIKRLREHSNMKDQISIMLYNFSRIINSGKNNIQNRNYLRDIFKYSKMQLRFVLLKEEFQKILPTYEEEIQRKKLVNHDAEFVSKYPLKDEFLVNLVIIELLSNEFLQREFINGHILRPYTDVRDAYVVSSDIITLEEDLKSSLNMLFDYVYKPYLLFDFSIDRRINDNKFNEVRIELKDMSNIIKKAQIKNEKKQYAVDVDKNGNPLNERFKMKSGECKFPFIVKKQEVYDCIDKHPADNTNSIKLIGSKFCATEKYGTETRAHRGKAKKWGRCVSEEEYRRVKGQGQDQEEDKPESSRDKDNSPSASQPPRSPRLPRSPRSPQSPSPKPKPPKPPQPPKNDKVQKKTKKNTDSASKRRTTKAPKTPKASKSDAVDTSVVMGDELPVNPPGWRGPFKDTIFIDTSKKSCTKNKSTANSKRINSVEEALQITSSRENFDNVFKEKTGCPFEGMRAIVKQGQKISIRGIDINSENYTRKFNENKLDKKVFKREADRYTYIKEEYYEDS